MLGLHLSLPSYLPDIIDISKSYGLETFQMFIRNNRNLKMRNFDIGSIATFNQKLLCGGYSNFVIHAPYALNPGTPYDEKLVQYATIVSADLKVLSKFAGNKFYVLHPGSSLGYPKEFAHQQLLKFVDLISPHLGSTVLCLEYMSGAGSQLISTPMELEAVAKLLKDYPVKFCYDSCHVFASGYNVVNVYKAYKELFGVVHINGSNCPLGSCKDNHTNLNYGYLPLCINEELYKEVPKEVPVILETPGGGALSDFKYLMEADTL